MKVGDLIVMRQHGEDPDPIGLVLRTKPDGINRGAPHLRRVRIYWIQDRETCWEPAKWLEVISEK